MDDGNALSWDELQDDSKVHDESEWFDADFQFTKEHPDWGADSIVKQYFIDAQKHKIPKQFEPDDAADKYEMVYHAINVNATKRAEEMEPYTHETVVAGAGAKNETSKE